LRKNKNEILHKLLCVVLICLFTFFNMVCKIIYIVYTYIWSLYIFYLHLHLPTWHVYQCTILVYTHSSCPCH
jgi:hypothetical protein